MSAGGDPLVSAVLLGLVLGLQHATDPDHLVAVATIVSREGRLRDGALIGTAWGLGHAFTLTLVGGTLIALNLTLRHEVTAGLELLVAGTLILLGAGRLWDALRDRPGGGAGERRHAHGAGWLVTALAGTPRGRWGRAFLVGIVHGMAGSAAASLLIMATLRSPWAAALYLAVLGIGTLAGMAALTMALAYPVSLALRLPWARRALAVCAGAGSIAFGFFYAARAI